MTRKETARVLAILRTIWPTTIIDEDTITAYQLALGNEEYPSMVTATGQWMRTGKFFPKPAELLEIVAVDRVSGDIIPGEAWAEVLREAGRVGVNGTPEFSNPLIARAAYAIGWRELCLTDEKHYPTLRAQFRDTLTGLRDRAVRQAQIGDTGGLALDEGLRVALANGRRA